MTPRAMARVREKARIRVSRRRAAKVMGPRAEELCPGAQDARNAISPAGQVGKPEALGASDGNQAVAKDGRRFCFFHSHGRCSRENCNFSHDTPLMNVKENMTRP